MRINGVEHLETFEGVNPKIFYVLELLHRVTFGKTEELKITITANTRWSIQLGEIGTIKNSLKDGITDIAERLLSPAFDQVTYVTNLYEQLRLFLDTDEEPEV